MRRLFVGVLLMVGLLGGCAAEPETAVISLSRLQPLPPPEDTDVKPLRVAVAAIISPQNTVDNYTPLLNYLSYKLRRPVELVQRRTYAEINELIKKGEVDLAFVCTSAYVVGQREFGMQLIVAPQVNGETVYRSLLIVPADSPAQSMADLQGKVFAFTDPMSNTGRNYPTFLVHQLGSTPETFFSRTFYTYSHDDAIHAVANRVADGAAVDSLVFAYTVQQYPELAEKVRVIHESPPFGIPPVVVGPHVRPQSWVMLRDILLEMDKDEAGRAALAAVGIDKFVVVDDSIYDSVRELELTISALATP